MSTTYCVIIPAYDAANTIGALVERIKPHGVPVLVIDDGSHDRTTAVASARGALVISHLRNEGKGRALRTGFQYALRKGYDGVITMDADGQHDPDDLPALIRAAEVQHAGLVIGNRMDRPDGMPSLRRWTNRVMSGIVSAVARCRVPDSQCGFRLIRKELLGLLPLYATRFDIETEILLKTASRRWKIVSVPIRSIYTDHPSHIRPLREGARFVALLMRHLVWP